MLSKKRLGINARVHRVILRCKDTQRGGELVCGGVANLLSEIAEMVCDQVLPELVDQVAVRFEEDIDVGLRVLGLRLREGLELMTEGEITICEDLVAAKDFLQIRLRPEFLQLVP